MTTDWKLRGLCVDKWELFDSDDDDNFHFEEQALALCSRCPVIRECREDVMKFGADGVIQAGEVF